MSNYSTKNTTSWSNAAKKTLSSFLLKEDTLYLLLETGDKIIITGYDYINPDKNQSTCTNPVKNQSTYTNPVKN